MTQETQLIRSVTKNYGTRVSDMKYGGRVYGENLNKTATWTFDAADLPVGSAAHNLGLSIPAGSTIVSAKLRILTAFVSTSTTTDLDIGLEQADGTDIDANGLITAAQATQTTILVEGALIDGSSGTPGALIGFTIGAAAGELMVIGTADDMLTGRGELIVEYLTPAAMPA